MSKLYVLIDEQERKIMLFGDQNKTIPFSQAFVLPSIINGRTVEYLQSSGEANGEDVVDYLVSIITEADAPHEPLFFRSLSEGYVRISDLKLVMNGPRDCKAFSTYGYDIFDRSSTLKKLLLENKIEILTESEAKSIRRGKLDQKSKDKALDEIILKTSVKDFQSNEDMFREGNPDEVTSETEVLTDADIIIRDYGIGKKDG